MKKRCKKILALLLTFSIFILTAFPTFSSDAKTGNAITMGDFNLNGNVTVTDAVAMRNCIFTDAKISGDALLSCDFDKNGRITVTDIIAELDCIFTYRQKPAGKITSITLGGYPLSQYDFVVPAYSDNVAMNFAKSFSDKIYEKIGIRLNVRTSLGSKKPFYIYTTSYGGATGFKFSVEAGRATLGCTYRDNFTREAEKFADVFLSGSGDLLYPQSYTYEGEGNVLYYSQFGAVGDGVTDDFDALYNTHAAANTYGYTVRADRGAVYYIGDTTKTVQIMTDTDWTGAKFIIDDTAVDPYHRGYNLFRIKSSYNIKTVSPELLQGLTLKKGQTNIGLNFGEDCMIKLLWNGHRVYIRYGLNENSGDPQSEMLLVDKDGNIDPSTPLIWNYDKIDEIKIYSFKDKPITLEGGTFITKANSQPSTYNYFWRNFLIERPHTTLKNIVHLIEGEGPDGAPYAGFFRTEYTYDVTFDSLTFTAHKGYKLETNKNVTMGSYDTQSEYSVKILWKNCKQSNSITDTTKWGVHASGHCKDLQVHGCYMNRFDAHNGMYNVTATDSTFGFAFNCIGGGKLYCKNITRLRGADFISLRSDYGSTWNGDVELIDCKFENYSDDGCTTRGKNASIFSGSYTPGWDFGYTCYMPQNVTFDNFKYNGKGFCYVFWNIPTSAFSDPINPYTMCKSVTFRNMEAGIPISKNEYIFASTKVDII